MGIRKLKPQNKIGDVATDDTEHSIDRHATGDHEILNAHVFPTLYGPTHPQSESNSMSTFEKRECNKLITDTDDSNNKVPTPDQRHTSATQRRPHSVISDIRQTNTFDIMSHNHLY